MVGIDNSVKVAKLISDLNSRIENLKNANAVIQEQLNDSFGREEAYQKRLDEASTKIDCLEGANKGIHAANKVLIERLNYEKEQKEKHIEFNKQLQKDIDKACYERDENRELADNYASEAYEWQKKYYREKEKHAKATKKVDEYRQSRNYWKSKANSSDWGNALCKSKHASYSAPKHAKKERDFNYIYRIVKQDEVKEEILDRCDFIDSEIDAWWKSKISTEELKDALVINFREIRDLAVSDYYISHQVGVLSTKAIATGMISDYDEDEIIGIQEAVDKIRQTVKETM